MTTSNLPPTAQDTVWDRLEHAVKEDRPVQPIRKIVVKGAVDVVLLRADTPRLTVAGDTADTVAAVRTDYKGDKLVIEREGVSISFGTSVLQRIRSSAPSSATTLAKASTAALAAA